MLGRRRQLVALDDRGPLRVMFLITSMPVGGAETLLINLIRRLDPSRFSPELCCLKELGPLGEELSGEIPTHSRLLFSKYDFRVLGRLTRLLRRRKIDAVVTVGAGDKMFWGRLAAWRAATPVVLSALHSTGWPDGVGRLNRLLTPLTDALIAVAKEHGRFLIENEGFPAKKVCVIRNGVDVQRFQHQSQPRLAIRRQLDIPPDAPVIGTVAALRPEKNLLLFLRTAALVREQLADAHFVIVGDGPEREKLETAARGAKLDKVVHFLGTRGDIPQLLSSLDLFLLTSHNEASPVSILEAMAVGLPVVSTRVGSIAESVEHGVTGYLTQPGDAEALAEESLRLMSHLPTARQMGDAGREVVVASWSLESMVEGYERLIEHNYQRKALSATTAAKRQTKDQQPSSPLEVP